MGVPDKRSCTNKKWVERNHWAPLVLHCSSSAVLCVEVLLPVCIPPVFCHDPHPPCTALLLLLLLRWLHGLANNMVLPTEIQGCIGRVEGQNRLSGAVSKGAIGKTVHSGYRRFES